MTSQAVLDRVDPLQEAAITDDGEIEIVSLAAKADAEFVPGNQLLDQLFNGSIKLSEALYQPEIGTVDPVAVSEILQLFLMTLQLCEGVRASRRWFGTPCALIGGAVPASLLGATEGRESIRAILHGALLGEFELNAEEEQTL